MTAVPPIHTFGMFASPLCQGVEVTFSLGVVSRLRALIRRGQKRKKVKKLTRRFAEVLPDCSMFRVSDRPKYGELS